MKKKFLYFILSFIFFSSWIINTSVPQVNTPPLSPEQAKVINPLRKINEGWNKKDMELFMSAYHEKAIIQGLGGAKVDKARFRRIQPNFGEPHVSYDVEKIEIKGEKATIECIMKTGSMVIPRKFDLVKEGEVWLIIGQWLR